MNSDTLVIGERLHVGKGQLLLCTPTWTLADALQTPAFTPGPTSVRLSGLVPPQIARVNLLPPHPAGGAWDQRQAKSMARKFRVYAQENGYRLILLGRRVSDAFLPRGVPFGTIYVDDVQFLTLPHPSGLSRALNAAEERERYRLRVLKFLAWSYHE